MYILYTILYRLYKNRYPDHSCQFSFFPYLYKNLHDFGSFTQTKRKTSIVNNTKKYQF